MQFHSSTPPAKPAIFRRSTLLRAGLAACALALAPQAFAQAYPSKAVKLMVPYAPGGAVDMMGRLIAKEMSAINGQPYIVENKGGAGGGIAVAEVARSAPDGYTILIGATGPNVIVPAVYGAAAGFDPIKDLVPISLLATTPYVLVTNPTLPVRNVAELISYAKAQGGKVNYASSGSGGPDHLAGELFKQLTGLNVVHVPYKGSGPALVDLVAGQVQYTFVSPLPSMPLVEAGKLRLLAVTGKQRAPAMPSVPAVAETVPGFEIAPWYGFFVSAGTPTAIVNKILADVRKVVATEEVQQALKKRGIEPQTSSPSEFSAFVQTDLAKWSKIVKDANIKP
ncbi:MAG: tripartite tricarboxylate transporter substrate binding protein [Burkholderiaceae bacterium]|nr:tripartite tricarboxylate transporter substrate binding protein [Burkholderiaceae bacterium]